MTQREREFMRKLYEAFPEIEEVPEEDVPTLITLVSGIKPNTESPTPCN